MFSSLQLLFTGLELGEGSVWLENEQALGFVDITKNRVYLMHLGQSAPQFFDMGAPVGCIVPMRDGRVLAAAGHTLVAIQCDTGKTEILMKLKIGKGLRFNDGKCDKFGRLWVGTMAVEQDLTSACGAGSLYCIEKEKIVFSQIGFSIPNGLAFGEGDSFYHTDTATGGIDLCELLPDNKTLTRKRIINIAPEKGAPDGFCCDTENNIWVALWGKSAVACINPTTGKYLHIIALPDKNASCCCFGGAELNTLFITTAKDENGNGGNLYAVQTKAKGVLPFKYDTKK